MGGREPQVSRFTIDPAQVRRGTRNTGLGLVLALVLSALAWQSARAPGEQYNSLLFASVVLFVGLFGLYTMVAHARYVMHSRSHSLEVGPDGATFATGGDTSELPWADVVRVERQSRMREGPSVVLYLKNGRFIRLVGYTDQERLTELVERYVRPERS